MSSLIEEEHLEKLLHMQSATFGPLHSIWPQRGEGEFDGLFTAMTKACGVDPFSRANIRHEGYGHALTHVRALIGSLGEALERYGATQTPLSCKSKIKSYREMAAQEKVWPLEDYQMFRKDGVPAGFRRFNEDESIEWLQSLDGVWIPSALLGLNFRQSEGLAQPNTNGLAIHFCRELAIRSAVCEVLERDAFLFHWWRKVSPPSFLLGEKSDVLATIFGDRLAIRLSRFGQRIRILDLSERWGLPTFACCLIGDPDVVEPAIIVLAAADESQPVALRKAVLETLRYDSQLRSFKSRFTSVNPPYDETVRSFEDIGRLLWSREMLEAAGFLFEQEVESPLRKWAAAGASLLKPGEVLRDALNAKDCVPELFDLTPIDLAQQGLSLIRAKIRQAIPLNSAHLHRPYGCPALRDVPLAELNQFPHPFT